jgi:carbonic anhydrase/acetyltransferase-like protein (isoleucine patch superfamily)
VILPDSVIPDKQLWAGNPAKYIRDVTDQELEFLEKSASSYVKLAGEHAAEFLDFGTAYQEAEKHGKVHKAQFV